MRNDPNRYPEEQQLTLNQKDAEFEAFYADILDEFGDQNTSEEDFLKELMAEPPREDTRHTPADRHTYADRQKKEAPIKKDHSIRNLTILIFVELLGIVGVAAWWVLRLL